MFCQSFFVHSFTLCRCHQCSNLELHLHLQGGDGVVRSSCGTLETADYPTVKIYMTAYIITVSK
jgi:hypothetical protein